MWIVVYSISLHLRNYIVQYVRVYVGRESKTALGNFYVIQPLAYFHQPSRAWKLLGSDWARDLARTLRYYRPGGKLSIEMPPKILFDLIIGYVIRKCRCTIITINSAMLENWVRTKDKHVSIETIIANESFSLQSTSSTRIWDLRENKEDNSPS